MSLSRREQILISMRKEAKGIGYITNWHLNDFFAEWADEYFYEIDKIRTQQRRFTYYANILVLEGFLNKARKSGAGFGSYSEFGCRTQTIWGFKNELQ